MSDRGHELTEELLEELEGEIKDEYKKALADVEKKLQDYLEKTEKGRLEQKALLDAGQITKKQYDDWVYRHTMVGKRWEATRDALAADLVHADATAQGLIRGKMPDVFALNMNYATYQVENGGGIDTGFVLYNRDTAAYLLGDQRELMPGPSAKKSAQIRANKDMQWNKQHIQSAVLQGVLQGESPYDVAARLRQVGQMDASASIRYARTMTTSAQNAGRYQAYRRARDLGVELTIEWQATLDGRTRHKHRMMHGQRREVDEPFVVDGIKILYPAEGGPGGSDIPQRLIWNCRCTLLSWVKGFEGDTVTSSPKMGDMSFEEWQEAKVEQSYDKASHNRAADEEQFRRYQNILGDKAPKDFTTFQDIKYNAPAQYEELKKQYRSASTGSRQNREKQKRVEDMPDIPLKPKERTEVVQTLKPIPGKHSRSDDCRATNPLFDTGGGEWHNNCQRCVTTYEARRRGYDVTALPCFDPNTDRFALNDGFVLAYERGERKVNTVWREAGLKMSDLGGFDKDRCLEAINSIMGGYGNGSRAIIEGFWPIDEGGGGHVFVAENVGGKVQFFDPQKGPENGGMDCKSYFDRMGPKGIRIFRVDDLPFTSEIKDVFRNDI